MAKHVPFSEEETFINNFYCHFPWPSNPDFPEGLQRHLRKLDGWDKTGIDSIRILIDKFDDADDFGEYLNNHSERYLNNTAEQFYKEVDAVTIELGLSIEVIQAKIAAARSKEPRLKQAANDDGTSQESYAANDRDKYLFPIYKVLRQRGYNKFELCA